MNRRAKDEGCDRVMQSSAIINAVEIYGYEIRAFAGF
jgi:hypothetical protein